MTLIRKMKGNDAAARGKVLWLYSEIVPTLGRLLAKISENEHELDSNSERCKQQQKRRMHLGLHLSTMDVLKNQRPKEEPKEAEPAWHRIQESNLIGATRPDASRAVPMAWHIPTSTTRLDTPCEEFLLRLPTTCSNTPSCVTAP